MRCALCQRDVSRRGPSYPRRGRTGGLPLAREWAPAGGAGYGRALFRGGPSVLWRPVALPPSEARGESCLACVLAEQCRAQSGPAGCSPLERYSDPRSSPCGRCGVCRGRSGIMVRNRASIVASAGFYQSSLCGARAVAGLSPSSGAVGRGAAGRAGGGRHNLRGEHRRGHGQRGGGRQKSDFVPRA